MCISPSLADGSVETLHTSFKLTAEGLADRL